MPLNMKILPTDRYFVNHRLLLQKRRVMNRAQKILSKINTQIRIIRMSVRSAEQKRRDIELLNKKKKRITKRFTS